jgi:hypothetical protein
MSSGSPVLRQLIFGLECHRDALSPQAILPLSVDSKGAQKIHTLRTKPSPPGSGTLWYGSEFLMSASDRIKRRALNSAVECHLHTPNLNGN